MEIMRARARCSSTTVVAKELAKAGALRMLRSWSFIALVVAGGVVVATSALYALAKESERRKRLAKYAWSILYPEIKSNLDLAGKIRDIVAAGKAPPKKFDVAGWEAISNEELLMGLSTQESIKLIYVYSMIYKINTIIDQMADPSFGAEADPNNQARKRRDFKTKLNRDVSTMSVLLSGVLNK